MNSDLSDDEIEILRWLFIARPSLDEAAEKLEIRESIIYCFNLIRMHPKAVNIFFHILKRYNKRLFNNVNEYAYLLLHLLVGIDYKPASSTIEPRTDLPLELLKEYHTDSEVELNTLNTSFASILRFLSGVYTYDVIYPQFFYSLPIESAPDVITAIDFSGFWKFCTEMPIGVSRSRALAHVGVDLYHDNEFLELMKITADMIPANLHQSLQKLVPEWKSIIELSQDNSFKVKTLL